MFKFIKKIFKRKREKETNIWYQNSNVDDNIDFSKIDIITKRVEFVIPMDKFDRKTSEESLSRLISDYKEEIEWDGKSEEIIFNKQYYSIWLPTKNNNK